MRPALKCELFALRVGGLWVGRIKQWVAHKGLIVRRNLFRIAICLFVSVNAHFVYYI